MTAADADYLEGELRQVTQRYQPGWGAQPPASGALHWRNAWDRLEAMRSPRGPLALLDGGGTQVSGVFSRDPGSPEIAGVYAASFTGYGVGQMAWNGAPVPSTGTSLIHDCICEDVAADPPRSMDGTGEAGFWLGQRTHAYRLRALRCAWMLLWTGAACDGSLVENVELLAPEHVAAYMEHVTTNTVFRRITVGPGTDGQANPFNGEWAYGGVSSSRCTFQQLDVYCPRNATGLFLDAGWWGNLIGDPNSKTPGMRFWGPGDAIGLPNNLAGPGKNQVVLGDIVFENYGKKLYYHDNAVGLTSQRLVQPARRLHPHTVRTDVPLQERLAAAASAVS